jgi:hypothetical protein
VLNSLETLAGAEKQAAQDRLGSVVESINQQQQLEQERLSILTAGIKEETKLKLEANQIAIDSAKAIIEALTQASDDSLSALRSSIDAQISAIEEQRQSLESSLSASVGSTDEVFESLQGLVGAEKQAAQDRLDIATESLEQQKRIDQDRLSGSIDAIKEAQIAEKERLSISIGSIKEETNARLSANKMALDAAREGLSLITKEASLIKSAFDSLTDSIVPQSVQFEQAIERLRNALRTGDLTGAGVAATEAAGVSPERFATRADFAVAQGQAAFLVSQLNDQAQGQLSTAEQTVQRLEDQTDVIRASSDAQIAALNDQSELSNSVAEAQIAALNEQADMASQNSVDQIENANRIYENEVFRLDGILENASLQIEEQRRTTDKILSVGDAIEALKGSLSGELSAQQELDAFTGDQQIQNLNQIYDTALSQLESLRGINSSLLDVTNAVAAFELALSEEAESDQAATLSTLEAQTSVIKASSDAQLAAAESQSVIASEKAESAIENANRIYENEVLRLDGILESARSQIEIQRGTNETLLSVDMAIAALEISLLAESAAQKELDAFTGQQQIESLNLIYDNALSQLNALLGIDSSVMGVQQALGAFNAALNRRAPTPTPTPTPEPTVVDDGRLYGLAGLYQELHGRGVDESGARFYGDRLASGAMTLDDVRSAILGSDEYRSRVPGFAGGGMHSGGLRIVGERGPELEATGSSKIMSNSELMSSLGGNHKLASEMKSMHSDMMQGLNVIAKNTNKGSRQLERWDLTGLPAAREFV